MATDEHLLQFLSKKRYLSLITAQIERTENL